MHRFVLGMESLMAVWTEPAEIGEERILPTFTVDHMVQVKAVIASTA